LYAFDVSLAADPSTSPPIKTQYGDTTYYFFETPDLPLFGPLRTLGVPERVIDVVEPFFRVLVELGYDRSIPPGEPTPARLIPMLDPPEVTADLVAAIGEGFNNALALIGLPPLLSTPPAPDTGSTEGDVSPQTARTAITQQMTSMVERSPADGHPADHLDATFDQNRAEGLDRNVEQNPAEVGTTFERTAANDLYATVKRTAADGIDETASSRTATAIQQTLPTETSRGTQLTATSRQSDQRTSAAMTRHRQGSGGSLRQPDEMTSSGATRHRQTTSTGGPSWATSSPVGSPPTGNSAPDSAKGDSSHGSTNGDSSHGSTNGDSSHGSANGESSHGSDKGDT
jgi:hypothetical protein